MLRFWLKHMKRAFLLILLAFATAACFMAAPAKPAAKKTKKPATAATAKTVHKPGTQTASRTTKGRTTRAASASNVKYVRNRHGKLVRVVAHAAPAPSYQLHPDSERYQQIQQALADKGYFKGEVNGQWGDDSVDALRRFQTDRNLDGDGHLTALSLTGLGLGPKHDHDLSSPSAPVAPPAVSNDAASKTASSTTLTSVVSSGVPASPKPPDK